MARYGTTRGCAGRRSAAATPQTRQRNRRYAPRCWYAACLRVLCRVAMSAPWRHVTRHTRSANMVRRRRCRATIGADMRAFMLRVVCAASCRERASAAVACKYATVPPPCAHAGLSSAFSGALFAACGMPPRRCYHVNQPRTVIAEYTITKPTAAT